MFLRWIQQARLRDFAIMIALITFALYAPHVGNNFVSLDDSYLIYQNPYVKGISAENITHAFTSYDPQLYIPLTFLSYQLNHAFTGLNPLFFHLTNLLLHIGSSVLLLFILFRITRSRFAAFFCALLFAIHPLNTEAVLWAAARKDVLATFFSLSSLFFYLRYRDFERQSSLLLSLFLFLLGLLSKVSIITLPLVFLLVDWREDGSLNLGKVKGKIPFFVFCVILGIVALVGKTYVLGSTDFLQNFLIACKSTVFYIRTILWPDFFSVIYPQITPVTFANTEFLFSFLATTALVLTGCVFLWTGRFRNVAFGLWWYLLFLAPNLPNFSKNGMLFFASDRYAYLASVGIFVIIASGLRVIAAWLEKKHGNSSLPFTVGLALSLVLLPLTFAQGKTWKDSIALYQNVLRRYPESAMAQNNLGMELLGAGEKEEGVAHLRQAMALAPEQSLPYFNVAAEERKAGRVEEALRLYRQVAPHLLARELVSPAELQRFFWLANRFKELGSPADTLPLLQKIAALAPQFVETHEHLGIEYKELGKKEEAIAELEKAVDMGSKNKEVYYHLAELYSDADRTADVIRILEFAVPLDPGNENVRRTLRDLKSGL